MKNILYKSIILFCFYFTCNVVDGQTDTKISLKDKLTEALTTSNIDVIDSTLKVFNNIYKMINVNYDSESTTYAVKFNVKKDYINLRSKVLTHKNTLLQPLFESVMNNCNDETFSKALKYIPQFERLYISDDFDASQQKYIDEPLENFNQNEEPAISKYIEMFQLASNVNETDINDNVCNFFNLKFESPLKKKVFCESEEFLVYKDQFLSFREYLMSSYFILKCPKIDKTCTNGDESNCFDFNYGIKKYDLINKRFPFDLSNNDVLSLLHNVRRNVYFPYLKTTPIRLIDVFYIPVNSEEIASKIEDYSVAYFIFKLKKPMTVVKGDRKETFLTAGKTQFVIADSRNNHVLYSKVFSEPVSSVPIKK